MIRSCALLLSVLLVSLSLCSAADERPYIKTCSRSDPQLSECVINTLHHLKPYLANGIPDIEMESMEPFIVDHLQLQLTGGSEGYRVHLKHVEIYGASNFSVQRLKLAEDDQPFELSVYIPKLTIKAKYSSSGVLIIIPASGGGDFAAIFDGVTAVIRGKVQQEDGSKYAHVESLTLQLAIKKVRMNVSKVFNNNRILTDATNLFLKQNGGEVIKAMQPQLEKKIASEFVRIANSLVDKVPIEDFYKQD